MYRSPDDRYNITTLLDNHHLQPSMSRPDNCYDNALAENRSSRLSNRMRWPNPTGQPGPRPAPPSSITSKHPITQNSSTALWAINHLWTLKNSLTKLNQQILESPHRVFEERSKSRNHQLRRNYATRNERFLNLKNPPARLTAMEAGWFLG